MTGNECVKMPHTTQIPVFFNFFFIAFLIKIDIKYLTSYDYIRVYCNGSDVTVKKEHDQLAEKAEKYLSRATTSHRVPEDYLRLRQIARGYVSRLSSTGSIQATELVHMAWLRVKPERVWKDKEEFLAYVTVVMKNILLDRARKRVRRKDHFRTVYSDFSDIQKPDDCSDEQIILLHQALEQMQQTEPDSAKVISLRFFVGLTNREIAEATDSSERTVKRKIAFARAYLKRSINRLISEDV